MDIRAAEEFTLLPTTGELGSFTVENLHIKAVCTGWAVEIPPGYELQVRPRSGLAAKHGVTVLNSPGTIDSDYRGEIKVILINLGDEPFTGEVGDRIAQLVLAPIAHAKVAEVDELSETKRGAGGFGSTGVA